MPTRTIQEIEEELHAIARKKLNEAGYDEYLAVVRKGQDPLGLKITLTTFSRKYDGWNPVLEERDWDNVLGIEWEDNEKRLLERLKEGDNSLLSGEEASKLGIEPVHLEGINRKFKRDHGKYILVSTTSFTSQYPHGPRSFEKVATLRLFIRS